MPENVNQPLPAGRLQSDAETPAEFGKKPWRGILGFLGGSALLAGAGALFFTFSSGLSTSTGRINRLPIYLGVFGLGLLISSFRIKGARMLPDGIRAWSYWFWFIGNSRLIPAEELGTFTLGESGGKFTVTVSYGNNGESNLTFPQEWAALKDAQAVISLGTTLYGVSAAVAITDPGMLAEAALFAAASRWTVMPEKKSRAAGERLRFADANGNAMGEIRVISAMFSSTRAEIADGPGDFEDSDVRWVLTKSSWGNIQLMDRNLAAGDLFKSGFNSYWTDCDGIVWSAKFTTSSSSRTPFTLKLYRGLATGVGTKPEQERICAMQGPAQAVAIADGPASCFHVDVADDNAWPWVRLALAAFWLRNRPQFNYKK